MPSVLHVLPHPGGGGERYVSQLDALPAYHQERVFLSTSRSAFIAVPAIARRRFALRRAALQADIVHLHGDMAAMLALSLLRKRPGVVTTHGLSFLRRARGPALRVAQLRLGSVIAAARRIVCSSRAEYEELCARYGALPDTRAVVVPNAVPLPAADAGARERIRAELGLTAGELLALCLGRLDRYKDPLTAVSATALARSRGASITLALAGDGPLEGELRPLAGSGVRLLGFRSDASDLLAAADLFVMPSRREGSSYALLEAMARHLAIVASDGAGIPETVGDAGIVLPVGDVEGFASAFVSLAADPDRRVSLGAAARARVAERFTVERFRRSMAAIYEAVLADRGAA